MFKEIWVHPFEHWIENSIILGLLIAFILYYIWDNKKITKQKKIMRKEKRSHKKTAKA